MSLTGTRAVAAYVQLPAKLREEVDFLEELVLRIDRAENKTQAVLAEEQRYGHMRGFDGGSIWRKYYAWVNSGRDRLALVNKSKLPRAARARCVKHLYKEYAEDNQRSSLQAWRSMLADLRRGKEFDGVGTWLTLWIAEHPNEAPPAQCPVDYVPRGWTYGNLQKIAGLTKFEKTASRIGLGAASEFVLPVLTTRVGLKPGQYYQFDDMWHDAEVNYFGQPRGLRPLEFCCYDVASGSKVAWGIRPRLFDSESGKHDQLKEREMRCLVAYLVTEVGYHKDGCVFGVEHGTAAVRDALEKILHRYSAGAIKVQRGGILGEQVHDGMWPGRGRGNFRFKALVESGHNLAHNVAAMLPGQTGKDRNNLPEQLHGTNTYNASLLKIAATLPAERVKLLLFPLCHFNQYVQLVAEIYERMDWRYDHQLEGWDQAGYVVSEYRLAHEAAWRPMAELLDLPLDQRAAIDIFLRAHTEFMRTRKLSPREVWNGGRQDLARINKYMVPDIMGRKDGSPVTVEDNGTIVIEDRYIGPGRHVYYASVKTPDGYMQSLAPGRRCIAHVLPYRPEEMFISDIDSGSVLGIAERYDRAPRYDQHAIEVLMGQKASHIKQLADPVRARHQRKAIARMAMIAHNTDVISGAPITPQEQDADERIREVEGGLDDITPDIQAGGEIEDEAGRLEDASAGMDEIFGN